MRPLRHNCKAALKGSLHQVLLSSLPNATMAAVRVSNILRRFSAVSNIIRSIARVVLGVGGLTLGLCASRSGAVRVSMGNPTIIATTSVARSDSIRVLGPSLCVYAISRKTRFRIHLSMGGNHNCIHSRCGGARSVPVNILPISSVCAPVDGIGCRIRGAHVKRGGVCSGLALSI